NHTFSAAERIIICHSVLICGKVSYVVDVDLNKPLLTSLPDNTAGKRLLKHLRKDCQYVNPQFTHLLESGDKVHNHCTLPEIDVFHYVSDSRYQYIPLPA